MVSIQEITLADYKESAVECEEVSVKNSESDSRFARPKDFTLNAPFKNHIQKVFEENKESMDVLAK